MENKFMAEGTQMESVQNGLALAPEQDNASALSEALGLENAESTAADVEQQEEKPIEETNKALKGRMKSYEKKGYERGQREERAKWESEKKSYEEKLAKYAERDLQDEAKKFAEEKGIPEEFALEYMRMKKGMSTISEPEQPKKQERAERYEASGNDDAQNHANLLMSQAETFERATGGAVTREAILNEFQTNPEIRAAVAAGDMDFADVGQMLYEGNSHAPYMVRNNGNGVLHKNTIAGMSDKDFAKLNDRVKHGAVFDPGR